MGLVHQYTNEALAAWTDCVQQGWEHLFSNQELNLGRTFYKRDVIKDWVLDAEALSVKTQLNGTLQQVRLERKENRLAECAPRDKMQRSLLVAGLYVLEELIAEHALHVPEEIEETSTPEQTVLPQVSITLRFNVTAKGIQLLPFIDKTPLNLSASPNPQEREAIIRLLHWAQKKGYEKHEDNTFFKSVESLCDNEKKDPPWNWGNHFIVQKPEHSAYFESDPSPLTLHLFWEQDPQDPQYALCKHRVAAETYFLTQEEIAFIEGTPKSALCVPSQGIFYIDESNKAFLKKFHSQPLRLPKYAVGYFSSRPNCLTHLSKELQEWQESLVVAAPQLPQCPDFLRPYQKQGVEWLSHLHTLGCSPLLADEMGLGKTLQVLTLLNLYHSTLSLPNLIVCPASVVPVWLQEANKFFPKLPFKVLGNNGLPENTSAINWVTSYAMLRRYATILGKSTFGYVILDEAQNIKNPQTQTAQICCQLRGRSRLAITGTPIENHLQDLWSIFQFLMPQLLDQADAFLEEYQDLQRWLKKGKPRVAPFILRRTKAEVARELPPKTAIELSCPLTHLQHSLYQDIKQKALKLLGNDLKPIFQKRYLSFLSVLMRLRQVCCDPALIPWCNNPPFKGSGKMTVLLERLEECLGNGHKVVIFSQFVSFLERVHTAIKETFPETPIFTLTGKTRDRATPIREYQERAAPCIFLASLRAGGTGITLHGADTVFLVDPWWNPAVEEQAIDRVHRIGQQNPVLIYRLIAPHTLEENIQLLKKQKKALSDLTLQDLGAATAFFQSFDSLEKLLGTGENEDK